MISNRILSSLALAIALVSSGASRDLAGYLTTKSDSLQNAASDADTIIPLTVNWPMKYAHLQTGTVWTTYDCFGIFGYPNAQPPSGPRFRDFEYPAGSGVEYMFQGALWVGGIVGQDTLVSVGEDGWVGLREFDPAYGQNGDGSVVRSVFPVDLSLHSLFTDTMVGGFGTDTISLDNKPLTVRVAARAHLLQNPPANDFILYDIVLTNIGSDLIREGFVGLFVDGDVGDTRNTSRFTDDLAGSLVHDSIVYLADNDGDLLATEWDPAPSALAIKVLGTSFAPTVNFNWWVSNGNPNADFGPRLRPTPEEPWRDFAAMNLGTPVSRVDKYYMLSHKEWDYDMIRMASISPIDSLWMYPVFGPVSDEAFDVRILLSAGPFDLAPGASSRIIFAMSAADTLHHVANNLNNLPNSPDAYLANLNFTGMLTNMHLADSLSTIILDPMLPTLGLREVVSKGDSTVIEWDPWVFPEVIGYDLYVEEVAPAELPYPGVVTPWLTVSGSATVIPLGNTYHHTLHGLDSQRFYKIAVANRTATASGQLSKPVIVTDQRRNIAPLFVNEFVFRHDGESMTLNWSVPAKLAVDHFNIYKFTDSVAASKKFHAFYDRGYSRTTRTPFDSFVVNGTTYWYYQTTPYSQVAGSQTSYTDPSFAEDAIYVVTAVDSDGFESEFSMDIYSHTIPVRDRQILLFTCYGRGTSALVTTDTILSFYDSILTEWSHDKYLYVDSINLQSCNVPFEPKENCVDWHDFMRYELVIFDDILFDGILSPIVARNVVRRILLSGGKVASFGPLGGMYAITLGLPPTTRFINDPTATRFFGIDSVRQMGPLYPPVRPDPKIDTVHGFVLAEPSVADIPAVRLDSLRNPASSLVYQRFPASAGPAVATFVIDSSAEVTHWYRSEFPALSTNEGQVVGLRSNAEGCETWLFGFHLWYMRHGQARDLIHRILTGQPRQSIAATIEVEPAYGYYASRVGGKTGTLRLGNNSDGHTIHDIDPATIRINGSLPVWGSEIAPNYIGFAGEVLSATFQLDSLVKLMEPLGTKRVKEIAVDGSFTDNTPFHTIAYLQTVGRYTGDVDGNYQINIADVTAIVAWFFHGGSQPAPRYLVDASGDCRANIVDVVHILGYLFRGGASPRYCGP